MSNNETPIKHKSYYPCNEKTVLFSMENIFKFCTVLLVLASISASGSSDISVSVVGPSQQTVIYDCFATGYFCVYNNEIGGTQTVTKNISNINFSLKTSFLFGGLGVAMQGTGKTAPDGDYIKYAGGGGCFVRISGQDAGKNLDGRRVISPDVLRNRYARLGITDFTGFGNLALENPAKASYISVNSVIGSTGRSLTAWRSISVDPNLISLGKTMTIRFKNNANHFIIAKSDDIGSAIKGKHIEIYLGQGQAAIDHWYRTGGNRYVDIYIDDTLPLKIKE
jgi:3D (Asp-Asp-Asp) domain-containing protein